MNVLFLSTWFPYPSDNGSKLRVYNLLRALAQLHAVTLVSFAFDTARPEQPGDLRTLCAAVQVVSVNPFAVNRAGTLRTFLSTRSVASRPISAMTQLVADALCLSAFDAVISSTTMMADYALQTSPGAATLLEEHNSLTRWMHERYAGQTNPLQRLRCWASWQKTRRYEAELFARFDLVTMVSAQDRATCLADLPGYGGSVAVVPNGVDCQHNHSGLAQPRPNTLVYNGSLTYSANYDAMRWFLAEVYPRIKTQTLGVSLTITGSTTGVDLAGLALDDSVRLTGFVDDVRLPVAGSAVCVAPIRRGGGTRLKILEAMALGTPVVSTSKGAEGLEVTPGHDILIADEPADFADHVIHMLRDAAQREQLATNARRLVEQRYDWIEIGRRFVDLVEEAVERHGMTDGLR